ncbi:MAG: PIG-L family deacetylase [Anaerolineales bacterium]|jgi:LmbE family N-acetylglucosaminyl deacetylase
MGVHLYLSPHLDDAVFSCGGLIAQQTAKGQAVTVVTVCSGDPPPGPLSPFAQELHGQWNAGSSPMASRREEDSAACGRLSAAVVHLEIADAIYRRSAGGQPRYPSEAAIFGPLHPEEDKLVEALAAMLQPLCPEPWHVYCPMGIGGHVDHRLTRLAAERLSRPLCYYHDLPYAARGKSLPDDLAMPVGEAQVRPLAETEIGAWVAAASKYGSQIPVFWEEVESMGREFATFVASAGGLQLVASR